MKILTPMRAVSSLALLGSILVGALMLGLWSYLWRVGNLRSALHWAGLRMILADPQEPVSFAEGYTWLMVGERATVILSVLAIAAAFTLLVIVGFSLSEAVMSLEPTLTPTP